MQFIESVPRMQYFNGLLQPDGYQQTDADSRNVDKKCLPGMNGFVRGTSSMGAVISEGECISAPVDTSALRLSAGS